MKRLLSLVLLTVCCVLLGSSSLVSAQDKPTESMSLNFGVIADAMTGARYNNVEITNVEMVGTADGITTSVEVVDYLSDGTQTTHSIIAILIGMVRNNRVVWRLNDITIDGEPATAQQARMIQRAFLRAWNNAIRQQIGEGSRTESVDLNESFIVLHYR